MVDNFGAINNRIARIERSLFEEMDLSKFRELPRLAKEVRHSLAFIEEAILAKGKRSESESKDPSSLETFAEKLKANFEICDEKFLKMQTEVEEFRSLFRECLRVSDFRDKEDLILILKRENEVKQKLLHKYKLLVDGELKKGEGPSSDFDSQFNKRFRTSTTFVKLLQEENAYLMSKNAEISEKVLASKMEINRRLEKIQKDMKDFWKSLSWATGKDAPFGAFNKKKKGTEAALAEFGRHKSDFRKMLLRHEKFVEQVAKSGEGILIEIQKEFGRLKKFCRGFGFLEPFVGKNDQIWRSANGNK